MAELIYREESYQIIGACFEVYNELGCGFLEDVYQEALEFELADRCIRNDPQSKLPLRYKEHRLSKTYRPDFICSDRVVVEIKAVSRLTDEHRAQVLNYLAAAEMPLGLLINFGGYPKLEYERFLPRQRSS